MCCIVVWEEKKEEDRQILRNTIRVHLKERNIKGKGEWMWHPWLIVQVNQLPEHRIFEVKDLNLEPK